MAIDAFLELKASGGAPINGESTDKTFKRKIALLRLLLSGPGWSRTTGQRIMSPLL